MIQVFEDMTEGASFGDGDGGLRAKRVFVVQNLPRLPQDPTGALKVQLALSSPGVPILGATYPFNTSLAFFCTNRSAEAIDNNTVRVTCDYSVPEGEDEQPPDPGDPPPSPVFAGTTTYGDRTNLDVEGNEMFVELPPVPGDEEGKRQHVFVDIQVPTSTIRFERTESGSPWERAKCYVGRVNDGSWAGDPDRTWLCTRLDGDTQDGGDTWKVTYEFQRRPRFGPEHGAQVKCNNITVLPGGWDAYAVFTDPDTGEPLPAAELGDTGAKWFQVYRVANFNDLDLI